MAINLRDGLLQIFDVDHGQCALLTMPSPIGARRVLVDCGHAKSFQGAPWYPGQHLEELGVTYVDMLICTNYDEDHASGFPDLEQRGITVGCIIGNPSVAPETIERLKSESGMGTGIQAVAAALAIRRDLGFVQTPPDVSGVHLTFSWNPYPFFEDENNLSLIVTLDVLGIKFMFPGDMERAGFSHLLETCPPFRNTVAGVNVLVASHHGRDSGICPAMFDDYGCFPAVVVISDDYKQYDTQETSAYYASKVRGLPWFRSEGPRYVLTTRRDGEIRFSIHGGACTVW